MNMYAKFGITLAASLVVMYLLTMSMVAAFDHVYLNLSNFWMALIMVSAMAVIMLAVMSGMYENKRLNVVLYAVFTLVFVGSFLLGRAQTFMGDEQFMKSMIPHHSRAILVCEEADLEDPVVIGLCDQIIQSQRAEISEMETILERY
jgi:uncharacterized protein (DUF305 family)